MSGNALSLDQINLNECVFSIADRKDALEITKLVNLSFRGDTSKQGWTTEANLIHGQRVDFDRIVEIIETPQNFIQLVRPKSNQEIIACSHFQIFDDHIYLGMLTVNPILQSKGLGRLLLKNAEEQALKFGKSKIKMTVIAQRTELISWYEKQGYRNTHERKPFPYGNPRFGVPQREDLYFEVLEKLL